MKTKQTIQEQLSSPDTVAIITNWLQKNKQQGRNALARHVCQELGLYDAYTGKSRLAGVLKALRVLEAQGYWQLPAHQGVPPNQWNPRRLDQAVALPLQVPTTVDAITGLQLVEVTSREDKLFRIWNELILTEHPLHDCRLVGRQLRYLISSDYGWLGAIGFGSCALRLKPRDDWIGWSESIRKAFQDRLINMTRFLIRPQVRCENLASRVLSLCMYRVGEDFVSRYGIEPWLVESFVDRSQYTGTCYQAANWLCIGTTAGRGRNAPNQVVTTHKDIYLYELNRHWQKHMGIETPESLAALVSLDEALDSNQWIEAEFGSVQLGHQDLQQRLLHIVQAKANNPSAPYTECFGGNRHDLKAYYRFIGNTRETISVESILKGHRECTISRMSGCKRVLVLQDTTDLDFSDRLHCNGLGDVGKNQTGAISHGLKMHSSLAISDQGLPLGVLGTQIYASHYNQADKVTNRPIEEKESYRWLETVQDVGEVSRGFEQTETIIVGDRESDIFELFDLRRRRARHVHLLVRARYNRCLEGETSKLFDYLDDLPVKDEAEIDIPRQREKKGKPSTPGQISLPARKAKVQLRWSKVSLTAPATSRTRHLRPVNVYALSVTEIDPPQGAKAVRWVLLTTLPITSRKQALRCLRWYTLRWRIEEWHRVLKSGCRIESHQHHNAERLSRAIAIDLVIAWRLMLLTLLGREVPEMPCKMFFAPWECRLLEQLQPLVAPETLDAQKKRDVYWNGLRDHLASWRSTKQEP